MMRVVAPCLALVFWASAGGADGTVTGEARVVDSDVIDVGGQRVMLYGLESVERSQTCRMNGKPWDCYAASVRQLETLVSLGPVECEQVGEPDNHRRILGYCEIAGMNLNEALVVSGFAVARPGESDRFIAAEEQARGKGAGLWQGEFQNPSDYRTGAGILVDRP